jgi:RNA polymerase sigma factor (TIGR02999 family)
MNEITRVLDAVSRGETQAAEQLLPLVYQELRRVAASKMALEPAGHTLQPTALVHEAWLKLAGDPRRVFHGRKHFFAAAAEAMRRILIDQARRKQAQRHGGHMERVDLEGIMLAAPEPDESLLAVNEALDALAQERPLEADLVKLRYFAGMTNDEAADALGIPARTAKFYWTHARAWLYEEIKKSGGSGAAPREGLAT